MDISKAVEKMRAQAQANRATAWALNKDADELIRQAAEKADELRGQAAEELAEGIYWENLADREATSVPDTILAVVK